METNRPTITPQGFVGVFIVLLGIVFTLDNLGLVESRQVLQYWPLAPIGIGLLIVIHANETRDWIRGTVWLTAGSLFLARNLGWIHFRLESFWPLLLVAVGLHIIFKAREAPGEKIDRRVAQLRRRQEHWQRRAERWQRRHPNEPVPWTNDWAKQWNQKWLETQHKFQDDWQHKFHEKFHEDWQDKLKHTIQNFATGVSDAAKGAGTGAGAGAGAGDGAGAGARAGKDAPPLDLNAQVNAVGTAMPYPGATGGPSKGGAGATGVGGAGTSAQGAGGTNAAGTGGAAGGGTGSYAGASAFSGDPTAPPPGFGTGWDTASGSRVNPDPFDTRMPPPDAPPSNSAHRVSMFALMGAVTRRVNGTPFYGANMTAVMGGIQLDLTHAQLPEDAIIELFAFWGGIEIWVPRDWIVVNQGFALMGSIEDKTGNLPQRPGQPRLVLRGMALMGGVEIKN
jgi:hypothetical protein